MKVCILSLLDGSTWTYPSINIGYFEARRRLGLWSVCMPGNKLVGQISILKTIFLQFALYRARCETINFTQVSLHAV